MTTISTTLDALTGTIARTMHETFKREIKAKLMLIANEVVEEAAEQIAKDITATVEHVQSVPGDRNWNGGVQVYLRVNEKKEKRFEIEKTVKEV